MENRWRRKGYGGCWARAVTSWEGLDFGSFNLSQPDFMMWRMRERSRGGRGIPLDFGLSNEKAEENELRWGSWWEEQASGKISTWILTMLRLRCPRDP